jgi:hypothetical protein
MPRLLSSGVLPPTETGQGACERLESRKIQREREIEVFGLTLGIVNPDAVGDGAESPAKLLELSERLDLFREKRHHVR